MDLYVKQAIEKIAFVFLIIPVLGVMSTIPLGIVTTLLPLVGIATNGSQFIGIVLLFGSWIFSGILLCEALFKIHREDDTLFDSEIKKWIFKDDSRRSHDK